MEVTSLIFLAAGAALVPMQAAVLARSHMGVVCRAGGLNATRAWLRRAHAFMSLGKGGPSSDALDMLVARRLELRRAAAARLTCTVSASILSLLIVSLTFNLALGRARWMTTWQTAIALAAYAMMALANAMPAVAPAARRLDFCHGLAALVLAAFMWFSAPEHLMFSLAACLLFQLVHSCLHLKIAQSIAQNLVVLLASCLRVWYSAQDGTLGGMAYMYAAVATLAVIIALAAFKYWTVAGVRQEIQFWVLKTEASASMSLLDMLCDVVVELSSDMTIARDSPAMASFLLLSPSKSVAGMHICDFVPDEAERCSFKDRLFASRTWPEASVGTCRTRFSDSMCSPVSVEVFFVKVNLLDEDCRYMLGIREFSDEVAPMHTFPKAESRPRRRREGAQKGTPHTCERASLDARDPREAPDPPAPQPDAVGLRYPGLMQTTGNAKCRELMVLASCWNAPVPQGVCCPFHAYVADVRALARGTLARLPCRGDFPESPLEGKQCQACGWLCGEHEGECVHCASSDLSPIPDATL